MRPDDDQFVQGILIGMREGNVSIPYLLLKYYAKLQLTELEAMLIIQLIAFKAHDDKDFPTFEELQQRLDASDDQVIDSLQKLLKQGLISIDEEIDAQSGIQYEKYNLNECFLRIAQLAAAEQSAQMPKMPKTPLQPESESERTIFTTFEREFARPLSPMECETISGWLDQDRYPVELILFALKEAVFAGKLHFRYIDRILLEWSRNRVASVEQAKEYARKFRGERI